jgi:hypothetical protein
VGYEGGTLRGWFGDGPVKHAAESMAKRGGEVLTTTTRAKTPVDTGHLEESWGAKPVLVIVNDAGEKVYESGTETHVDYAPDVEWGTGLWGPLHAKYLIVPKKPDGWLHWVGADGRDVFAKKVWHPGSPGAHMVAIAVAATEAELHAIVEPMLVAWAREQELSNPDARPGVV